MRKSELKQRSAVAYFASSAEHVMAELGWLELLLQKRVLQIAERRDAADRFDEFSGLFVSEHEIAGFVNGATLQFPADSLRVKDLTARIEATRHAIDRQVMAMQEAGDEARLLRLQRRFDLSAAELRILLTCLAPDWELRFQRYFAYLQNDVAKSRPTIQLLRDLYLGDENQALESRSVFSPEGTLLREQLLSIPARDATPFPARQPQVAEAVVDYLAGHDRTDALLTGVATLEHPDVQIARGEYFNQHRQAVLALLGRLRDDDRLPTAYVSGADGCGKSLVSRSVAALAGARLLRADCRRLTLTGGNVRDVLRTLRRDARLHGCLLEFSRCEALLDDATGLARTALDDFLSANDSAGIMLTGTARFEELTSVLGSPLQSFQIARPAVADRAALWRDELHARGWTAAPDMIDRLSVAFRFTPLEIAQALDGTAPIEDDGEAIVDASALMQQCRTQSRHSIHRFARKIVPVRSWNDLVLPADAQAQLAEICAAVRLRRRVYEEWGFEKRLALNSGMSVLFAGPSGVGKTMSAEIIAGDLGLDLFAVDLSCVVSKYIGETEKNLSKVFDEAESTNGVLFFDECDALFGKRTEVKDAHDRYANIEVNYLLQRIDQFDGAVVILSTNFRSNLDTALTRRLRYIVEFPFPEEEHRERIWRGVFPDDVTLGADVDFGFLARQFKLAGGNIRNIALNGAFLAASGDGCIGMKQLILATRRELQKAGKTCSKSEFGRYYSWVREEASA